MLPQDPAAVIGASGRSGAALCRALSEAGRPFVPVVRDAGRWAATAIPGPPPRVADLRDASALRNALAGAARVVSCAHARHAPAVLAAAPSQAGFVFLGSTRKFTRWPDEHARGVLAGEAAFLASGRNGVMLHPTMIYGAQGEDNVQRLARLLHWLPLVPLPGGGWNLVQPIWQGDVTRCVLASLDRAWTGAESLVIAGPEAMTYRAFVVAVARAAGSPRPRVVGVPPWLLAVVAPVTRVLPGVPRVRAGELRRLLEDKGFDVSAMTTALGVRGQAFDPARAMPGPARTVAA